MGLFDAFKNKSNNGTEVSESVDKSSNCICVKAFLDGEAIPMNKVDDPTFAQEILGPGIAIEPTNGHLVAPVAGEITLVAPTDHAVSITTEEGAEILMHIGIDTVELQGKHFNPVTEVGAKVNVGDALIDFDLKAIKDAGYKTTVPLILCNKDSFSGVKALANGSVQTGDEILKINK